MRTCVCVFVFRNCAALVSCGTVNMKMQLAARFVFTKIVRKHARTCVHKICVLVCLCIYTLLAPSSSSSSRSSAQLPKTVNGVFPIRMSARTVTVLCSVFCCGSGDTHTQQNIYPTVLPESYKSMCTIHKHTG